MEHWNIRSMTIEMCLQKHVSNIKWSHYSKFRMDMVDATDLLHRSTATLKNEFRSFHFIAFRDQTHSHPFQLI